MDRRTFLGALGLGLVAPKKLLGALEPPTLPPGFGKFLFGNPVPYRQPLGKPKFTAHIAPAQERVLEGISVRMTSKWDAQVGKPTYLTDILYGVNPVTGKHASVLLRH